MKTHKLIDSDDDIKEKDLKVRKLLNKVLLVGDTGVGKTSIIKRYIDDTFSNQYQQTKGVEFFVKKIELNKNKITLKIWDISGDSLTNKIIETYLHNSKAVNIINNLDSVRL